MPIDRSSVLARAKGRTLADIAASTGIAAPNLSRILAGDVDPRLSTVERLARELGCRVSDLLTHPR